MTIRMQVFLISAQYQRKVHVAKNQCKEWKRQQEITQQQDKKQEQNITEAGSQEERAQVERRSEQADESGIKQKWKD